MASALTVLFLGCWLAGHSGVWGEPSYPKPSISLSPSQGVSVGGAVAVWCRGKRQGMQFVLNKEGRQFQTVTSNGLEAVFSISNVSWEDRGSYNCSYHSRSEPFTVSSPSDPVELVVRDASLPRPSISLSPTGDTTPGADVIIRCQGQQRDARFFLHRAGDLNPPRHMDPAGDGAEFHIPTVGWPHGGNYSCSYRPRSEPFVSSQPSDPVQLVVADASLPRPSISLSPTGDTTPGADVIIRCQGQQRDARFFLHRAGDLNPPRHMDPAGDGAEFHIPTVGWPHGGNYSCSYRPRSEPFVSSQPSDPVQLVVAEPSYPKPSISLSPSQGVSVGGAVAVWCRGKRQGMQFVLNKEGRQFQTVTSNGLEAVFSISNVSWEDRGSYNCSYHSRSEPFTVSSPSDPVELVVRDPSLPRPSISVSLASVTASGADVTIRCQGQGRDVRFFLHKAGDLNLPRHMDPAGDGAEFHIPTVGRQHGGSYSCSYRPRSEPFISSQPSDPVQLVVAGREFLKPTISVSPSRVVALGGSVTIRCEGSYPGREFFLHKAGHPNLQVQTVPDGTVAEFPIPSVSQEDGGSYTCDYRSITDQNCTSHPSDAVEIIVGEPSYPKPSISLSPSWGVALGGAMAVWCQGQHRGVRFVLNKERRHFSPVDSNGFGAVFPISKVRWEDRGSYSCSYHSRSEPFAVSSPSDPVELVLRDAGSIPAVGINPTQPGAAPAPTQMGSAGPAPGLTSPIIAGASAAAAGLLLLLFLLVAFVCFRKTRARKGAALRPSSTILLGKLEALDQQNPIHSSIDEGKQPQTLEPHPGANRLTYAELDVQALHAKRGGPDPAPEPTQPTMYAVINVSRGALQ
ncbi:immunoglobulin superfamily member 1-like isoform X3 [Dermochelys coriacea]|uniref:immunoglobulin superfamily member 1-like isoform X3 n=1 Tax=Dermochelys coriacea TaxID=27794 RepID=UPI001CA97E68|nr:immunoglobulin superfamily member 1-like isoform X3 [Dermochelys coriacea]